jgi:hypothetical protein
MPTFELSCDDLVSGISINQLLKNSGLASSNSEGKRLVKGNSVSINDIKINDENTVDADLKSKIIGLLSARTSSSFNGIRQLVADEGIRQFEELYQVLFDKVDEYAKDKQTLAILTIAEYLHQSSLVVNKEITFMACIARLLKELK